MAWTKHDAGSGQDGVPVEPFWESFRLDPRQPGHAPMRASDADREIVRATLGDAFADGRLTREEYDDRLNTLYGSRTLGEVSSLVTDLVPLDGSPMAPAPLLGADMRTRAARKWRKDVEESLAAFIICTVIWIAVTGGGFFWPVFPCCSSGSTSLRLSCSANRSSSARSSDWKSRRPRTPLPNSSPNAVTRTRQRKGDRAAGAVGA
jgi:Domain of unknown function (DUF1707)